MCFSARLLRIPAIIEAWLEASEKYHHARQLPHAEIVVRAPHRHLGADPMVEGARKPPAAPLEIGEDAISSLGAQRRVRRLQMSLRAATNAVKPARSLPERLSLKDTAT